MTEFLLGLPTLADGALWRTARRLGAPVLISANALSVWRTDTLGLRQWRAFSRRNLHLVAQHPVMLDSGGFVAAARYRGFEWSVGEYLALCAAAPWTRFASMDWCVEPEIAGDHEEVLDRISGTVRLNGECLREACRLGIADRFMPVIQDWEVDDYLRCLDLMFDLDPFPVVGVGSMCRRHVEGPTGILQVLHELDEALGDSPVRLHLFGLKSQGMEAVRAHPRVASFDSQAYGVAARQNARKAGVPKSDAYVAREMERWYCDQRARLAKPDFRFRAPRMPAQRRGTAARERARGADRGRTRGTPRAPRGGRGRVERSQSAPRARVDRPRRTAQRRRGELTAGDTGRVACALARDKAPGSALARARPCPGRRRTPCLIGSREDLTGERRCGQLGTRRHSTRHSPAPASGG